MIRWRVVSLLAPSNVVPALLVSARACRVAEVIATDRRAVGSTVRYLQVHDLAAIAANVAPALTSMPLRGEDVASYAWELLPFECSAGLVICVSSTPDVYTALAAGTDFSLSARVSP